MVKKAVPRNKSHVRFEVPDDDPLLEAYASRGLVVPVDILDKENISPLDFTSISSREIGQQLSAWTARHAYILFHVGQLRSVTGNAKFDLRVAESKFRRVNGGRFKRKYELDDAMMKDKKLLKLRTTLNKAENELIRLDSLADAYQAMREAASREITRRIGERSQRE